MNLYLERIRKLYEGYLKTAEELEKNRKIGDGLFGLGHGPEDDPCHERFEKALESLLMAFDQQEPSSDEVREVLEFLYADPGAAGTPQSAYWVLIAVQGFGLPLIKRLDREDARMLREAYDTCYPAWKRLPVQKRIIKDLRWQSG